MARKKINGKMIMTKKPKKEMAKKILTAILENAAGFTIEFAQIFKYPHITKDFYQSKYSIKKEIIRLKKKKYLEERKRGKNLELYLTEKGKKEALRYSILNCNNHLRDKYCIVVFDIPETERNIRNFFRRFLKDAEFIALQKSVWVTQKDVMRNLMELIRVAGAEKWIHVITATEISNFDFRQKNVS